MPAKLRLTLVKSPIGHTARTRGTLRALGLRRVGHSVEVDDNPQMRGMARTVRFLVQTEEAAAEPATRQAATPAAPAAEERAPSRRGARRSKKEEETE